TLGPEDGSGAVTFRLGDERPPGPLGRHLPGHGLLHRGRRDDLPDLHVRHLDAPALGDLVELDPQHLVDLVALGQHVVERDVTDRPPWSRSLVSPAASGRGSLGTPWAELRA